MSVIRILWLVSSEDIDLSKPVNQMLLLNSFQFGLLTILLISFFFLSKKLLKILEVASCLLWLLYVISFMSFFALPGASKINKVDKFGQYIHSFMLYLICA
jgi:hypothetical protein